MRREGFVFALCAMLFALCPLAAAQQPKKAHRIGYLNASSFSTNATRMEAFRQGLRDLNYVEGKNIIIEWRSADGKSDRLAALAAELVRLPVEVIVTGGSTSTRAAKTATSTIPIVITNDPDPVGDGLVSSLARPGKHHGTVHPCPGAKRQTTGDSQRGCPQALPSSCPRNFNPTRLRTSIKRIGSRRKGIGSEAAKFGRSRLQGH